MTISGIQNVTQSNIQEAKVRERLLKLIGRARRVHEGIEMTVSLEEVGQEHPFYSVNGIWKAVLFNTELLGEVVVLGSSRTLNWPRVL